VLWTSTPKSQEKQLGSECVEPQKDIWGVKNSHFCQSPSLLVFLTIEHTD